MKTTISLIVFIILSASIHGNSLPPLPAGKAKINRQQQTTAILSMPRIEGNSIVCGNKLMTFDLDGKIKISIDGVVLGELYCYYSVNRAKDGKTWWGSFDKKVSSLKRNGDVFEWNLSRQIEDQTWKGAEQKVSITPEGLVKVEFTHLKFEHPELSLRTPAGSLWFMLNNKIGVGAHHALNDTPFAVPPDGPVKMTGYDGKNFNVTYFEGDTENEFKLLCDKNSIYYLAAQSYSSQNQCRFTFSLYKESRPGVIFFDLRKGVAVQRSNEMRAGIDFQKIETLELPDGSRRNLLPNSSFERGLECYRLRHSNTNYRWGWKSYKVQNKEAFAGNNALELYALREKQYPSDDFRRLNVTHNVTTATSILPPGTYTFSLYAKCTSGEKALVNVWIPNYFSGSIYYTDNKEHIGCFPVEDQWNRRSFTFSLDRTRPVEFHINAACLGKGDCLVWLDALQLERGNQPTAYDPPATEGRLLTSETQNFVNAMEPVDGRLLITTAKPSMKGTVKVRVKNFFSEILLNQQFTFETNANGTAVVPLPLDELPGLGVFMVRADYTLADGSKSFDHHRYAHVHYLDNTNPLSRIFCFHYGQPELSSDYPEVLERWKMVGVASRFYHYSFDKEIFDLEKKYNLSPGFGYLFSFIREERPFSGFAILDSNRHEAYLKPDDPRILIRDHNYDSNGFPTPDYLEKFKDAVSKLVAKYPHVPMWIPDGEAIGRFPVEWWSKEGTPEQCAKIRALILKAFVEGVHQGNPKALAVQDAPCNMRPRGGIAETDLLLQEADKIGCKFDVIGIHPYRSTPENPDLDSDTALFLKVLEKHGYAKTPVIWSEMMHWGPYSIPQLDIDFQRWGKNKWFGGFLTYDISEHEKVSASYYARSWLVALKYADRIVGATAGNFHNNCFMDIMMTPFAAQLVPNTLNGLLGNSTFRDDVRFAPYIRTYIFEDAQKRPVAAIWCHREEVDEGLSDAPVVEADFADALEGVFDLMNSPRAFTIGKFRFPVSGCPVFLRGKPGSLPQFQKAFKGAAVISGEGISPISAIAKPATAESVQVTLTNHLGLPYSGTLNERKVVIPAAGTIQVELPVPDKISAEKIKSMQIPLLLKGDNGSCFKFPQKFETFAAKSVPDDVELDSIDWNTLPKLTFQRRWKEPATSGTFQIGWNHKGLFIRAQIKDANFVHAEYKDPVKRWKNDCIQIFFDTVGDARAKKHGYDENDCNYGIFPDSKGESSGFFLFRPVEQQLGMVGHAPRNHSFIPEVPTRFNIRDGVLTYEAFIRAPYLLPLKLQTGSCFGFALFAPDSSKEDTINGALTMADDGGVCSNRPHVWPLLLLVQ